MRALAIIVIGAAFLIFSLLGSLVPGAAFHVYFGTEDVAKKWHTKNSQNHDHPKTNQRPATAPR